VRKWILKNPHLNIDALEGKKPGEILATIFGDGVMEADIEKLLYGLNIRDGPKRRDGAHKSKYVAPQEEKHFLHS